MNLYVTIKRKLPFNHEQQTELKEWDKDSKRSIGSYFRGGGSIKVGTGLSIEEEDLLMPHILDIPAKDPTFRKEVSRYFIEIDTDIPQEGRKLNIALKNNSLPLSETNLPVNIEDYVRYRHALEFPKLSIDEKTAMGNPLIDFYIENPEILRQVEAEVREAKDRAYAEYLSIKNKPFKVDVMLTLLNVNIDKEKDKITKLAKLAEENPIAFHNAFEDRDGEIKYEIMRFVEKGLLRRVGQGFLLAETGEELAFSIDEMVLWMKDKKRTKEVNVLRGQFKQLDEHSSNAYSGEGGISGVERKSEENNPDSTN